MRISDESMVARCKDTAWQEVEDRVVVVTPLTRKIHLLSGAGGVMWKRLEEPVSFADLVDAVCDEFEIDRETAARDAAMFLEDLAGKGVVEIRSES